jgi:hypothetical protein
MIPPSLDSIRFIVHSTGHQGDTPYSLASICNIPDIKSMQNINKMREMADEQQYNQNNTTIILK